MAAPSTVPTSSTPADTEKPEVPYGVKRLAVESPRLAMGLLAAKTLLTNHVTSISLPVDMAGIVAGAAHKFGCDSEARQKTIICHTLKGIENFADKVSDTLSYPADVSLDWVVEHAMGKTPASETGAVVSDHLASSGVPIPTALALAAAVEAPLGLILDSYEKGGTGALAFHAQGPDAVTYGKESPQNSAAIVLEMDTLKDIHEKGMPAAGAAEIRANLEKTAQSASDYKIVEHFGHDMVAAVQSQGYPHSEVAQVQQHIYDVSGALVPPSLALQALSHAAREGTTTDAQLQINPGVGPEKATVSLGELRTSAGLDPSASLSELKAALVAAADRER